MALAHRDYGIAERCLYRWLREVRDPAARGKQVQTPPLPRGLNATKTQATEVSGRRDVCRQIAAVAELGGAGAMELTDDQAAGFMGLVGLLPTVGEILAHAFLSKWLLIPRR